MPSPYIPTGTLPIMFVTSNASATINEPHPHPLRSHSTEALNSKPQQGYQEWYRSDRPDTVGCPEPTLSSQRTDFYNIHRAGNSCHSIASLPRRSALKSTKSAQRLSDTSDPSSVGQAFPIVPTRPPLKPTVSFGGVSTYSYYSAASVELEQKSMRIALDEEHRDRSMRGRLRGMLRGWRK